MLRLSKLPRFFVPLTASILLSSVSAGVVHAQDTTTTTVKHGASSYDTQVTNAEVVYVQGNSLVLRMDDGRVEHFVVPDSDRFTVNGQQVTVSDLTPGTKLTQTITTTSTPRYVTTVRTIKGTVWHVNAPRSVILRLPDNTNQVFDVPDHATFTIGGQPKTVFDLRKGMNVEATVVTDSEETVVAQDRSVVAQLPRPATPSEVGVLLIIRSRVPWTSASSTTQPAETAEALPKTASLTPLAGLLGLLAITLSVGLTKIRRSFNV